MSILRQRRTYLLAGLALGLSLIVLFALQATTGTLLANAFLADPLSTESAPLAQTESSSPAPAGAEGGTANCRWGLAALTDEQVDLVDNFGSGMFVDFRYDTLRYLRDNPLPTSAQYLPLVAVKEDKNGSVYLGTYTTTPSIEITDGHDDNGLRYWLERYPGRLWNIGNEIERGPNPDGQPSSQGDTHADVYAQAYKEIRDYIKKYDPTARTTFSALVQVTPIRLAYLEMAWDAHIDMYGHPPEVDAWTMHLYILPEVTPSGQSNAIAGIPVGTEHLIDLARRESGGDPALCADDEVYCYAEHDDMAVFAEQIVDMRTWMKAHGQQNKPLLLTEYSLLYPYIVDPGGTCFVEDEYGQCFTPPRVEAFMDASLDYLTGAVDPNLGYPLDGNRLVQQWVWFSINNQYGAGSVSNLYNHDSSGVTNIRPLGQMYKDRILSVNPTLNLVKDSAGTIFVSTDGAASVDVDIWAMFRNSGNSHVTDSFNVKFYSNAALTNPIGTITITPDPIIAGCAQMNYEASLTWNDLATGVHRYWAKIDSGNEIGETNENDNVVSGIVFVNGDMLHLPIMSRP